MKLRNKKGSAIFLLFLIFAMGSWFFWHHSMVKNLTYFNTQSLNALTSSYTLNALHRLGVNEYKYRLTNYSYIANLDKLDTSDIYDSILDDAFATLIDSSVRLNNQYAVKGLNLRDTINNASNVTPDVQKIANMLFSSPTYSEYIRSSNFMLDLENDKTVLNYQNGDKLCLEPILVYIGLQSNSVVVESVYRLNNISIDIEYPDEYSILAKFNLDECTVERVNYVESVA